MWQAIKKTFAMSLPLVGTRLLHASSGFITMALFAHLGKEALAAGGLIATTQGTLQLLIWSLLYAVSVLIGRAFGAGENKKIGLIAQHGFLLALLLAIPFSLLTFYAADLLNLLHEPQNLIDLFVRPYFHIFALSILPSLFYMAFNELALGIGKPRLIIWWTIFSAPFTIFFSYVFLFGKFGFPNLGVVGLAWAYVIVDSALMIFVALYFYLAKAYRSFGLFDFLRRDFLANNYAAELWGLGLPISLQFGGLALVHSTVMYLIGWYGTSALAAQQIATQYIYLVIMFPYGINKAASVLVAQALGRNAKINELKQLSYAALLIGGGAVGLFSVYYFIFPDSLMALYLNTHSIANLGIVMLATVFLWIAGVNQIFDAGVVIISGVLRGFKDTKWPMYATLLVNWLISIPLGVLLAKYTNLQAIGINLGLLIGTVINCGLLWYRMRRKLV